MLRTIAFYDRMQPASPSSVPRAIGLHGKVLSGVPQNTIVCSLHTIALRLHSSVCFWKSAITSYAENEHASSQRQIRLYFFRRSIRSWVYNHIHQPKQVTRYRPETPRPVGIGIAFSASPPKIRSHAACIVPLACHQQNTTLLGLYTASIHWTLWLMYVAVVCAYLHTRVQYRLIRQ